MNNILNNKLNIVAYDGNLEIVKQLIQYGGAYVNAHNNEQNTALNLAVMNENYDMYSYLYDTTFFQLQTNKCKF